jgi:antitoxin component YwqK of YwqJK toxin-antitoxin module
MRTLFILMCIHSYFQIAKGAAAPKDSIVLSYFSGTKDTNELKTYRNGELHGRQVKYGISKKKIWVYNYFHDMPHGRQLRWNEETGKLQYNLNFEKGKLNGKQVWYGENDIEGIEEIWNEGKLKGEYKWDVEDGGRVLATVTWLCNVEKAHVPVIGWRSLVKIQTFYGDTTFRSISDFTPGGIYTMHYPDGKLKCMGPGTPLHPEGYWVYRYPSGVLLAECQYPKDEILVSTQYEEDSLYVQHIPCLVELPLWEQPNGIPEELEKYVQETEPVELAEDFTMASGDWKVYTPEGKKSIEQNRETGLRCQFAYDSGGTLEGKRCSSADTFYSFEYNSAGDLFYHNYSMPGKPLLRTFLVFGPKGNVIESGYLNENGLTGINEKFDSICRKTSFGIYQDGEVLSIGVQQYEGSNKNYIAIGFIVESNGIWYKAKDWQYNDSKGRWRRWEIYDDVEIGKVPKIKHIKEFDTVGRINAEGDGQIMKYYVLGLDTFKKEIRLRKWGDNHFSTVLYHDSVRWDVELARDTGLLYEKWVFYPSGSLKKHQRYSPDSIQSHVTHLHGIQQGFFENGNLWFEADFDKGMPGKSAVEYYESGKPRMEWKNCKKAENGQWVCEQEFYYTQSGKKIQHTPFYTEKSKLRYNLSHNPQDLEYKPRSEAIKAILEGSYMEWVMKP